MAGELRLWRGWPTDWDGPALVREAAEVAPKVVRRARVQRVDPDPDGTARHPRSGPGRQGNSASR
ncbi:hypothetical protein SALBM135S_08478 [Streptomyces alboniger]